MGSSCAVQQTTVLLLLLLLQRMPVSVASALATQTQFTTTTKNIIMQIIMQTQFRTHDEKRSIHDEFVVFEQNIHDIEN